MKKYLLLLSLVLLITAGVKAQISYGLKAGVNLGKFSNSMFGGDQYETNNVSFFVTGFSDIPIASKVVIQPGISLQGKGSKSDYGGSSNYWKTNLLCVEIPVNAVYYIPTGTLGSVFLGAGPYVGFNIGGKYKAEGFSPYGGTSFPDVLEWDIEFGSESGELNRIEAGANFMLGYKLNNGFLINAGYGLGLTKLSNSSDNEYKVSNRVLSFGVGFQF